MRGGEFRPVVATDDADKQAIRKAYFARLLSGIRVLSTRIVLRMTLSKQP